MEQPEQPDEGLKAVPDPVMEGPGFGPAFQYSRVPNPKPDDQIEVKPGHFIPRAKFSEMGRKGGPASTKTRSATAAKKRKMRADLLAQRKFQDKADLLAGVVINAALGHGDFKALSPRERAGFAIKALEYGIGRPRPVADPVGEGTEAGLHFQMGPTEAVEQPAEIPPSEPPVETQE